MTEQELKRRFAEKQAQFWRSQGQYAWADGWENQCRHLRNPKFVATAYMNNPAQQVHRTKKRPLMYQGVSVQGGGDSLVGLRQHTFRRRDERKKATWYYAGTDGILFYDDGRAHRLPATEPIDSFLEEIGAEFIAPVEEEMSVNWSEVPVNT